MAESEPERGDSMDGEANELGKYAGTEVLDDCPLSRAQQTRNILLYASIIALVYLGAPVLYVGMTQASLLDRLGHSKSVSNVPMSVARTRCGSVSRCWRECSSVGCCRVATRNSRCW